jgi:hypothetical protein
VTATSGPRIKRPRGQKTAVQRLDEALQSAPWHDGSGREPRPAELDDWLGQQSFAVRCAFFERWQRNSGQQVECFVRDHEGQIASLQQQLEQTRRIPRRPENE